MKTQILGDFKIFISVSLISNAKLGDDPYPRPKTETKFRIGMNQLPQRKVPKKFDSKGKDADNDDDDDDDNNNNNSNDDDNNDNTMTDINIF